MQNSFEDYLYEETQFDVLGLKNESLFLFFWLTNQTGCVWMSISKESEKQNVWQFMDLNV